MNNKSPGRGFVRHIERRSGGVVEARVVEAGLAEAMVWHRDVQEPFIAPGPSEGPDARVDRLWSWPVILVKCGIFEELVARRECAFAQLHCRGSHSSVPVGQILMVNGFPHVADRSKRSMFLWYLTAMPPEAMRHFGVPDDLKLLRPLVDVGLRYSEVLGHDGRSGLHADRHGPKQARNALAAKYSAIGMQRVRKGLLRMFVGFTRPNDGRYFFTDPDDAVALSSQLDHLR